MAQAYTEDAESSVLEQIEEGMKVVDLGGEEVGEVKQVFLGSRGSDSIEQAGDDPSIEEAVGLSDNDSFIDNLAEAIAPENDIPDTIRERMLRKGFLRIDASGLFTGNRYVMPEQIVGVSDGRVKLKIAGDDMMKF